MTKKAYWLTDGYGSKAFVEGAEERDRLVPLGWVEADEPTQGDRVWMRHEGHGGRAQFAAAAMEPWQAKGWQPSGPVPAHDPFSSAAPADVVDTEPTPQAAPPAAKSKEK